MRDISEGWESFRCDSCTEQKILNGDQRLSFNTFFILCTTRCANIFVFASWSFALRWTLYQRAIWMNTSTRMSHSQRSYSQCFEKWSYSRCFEVLLLHFEFHVQFYVAASHFATAAPQDIGSCSSTGSQICVSHRQHVVVVWLCVWRCAWALSVGQDAATSNCSGSHTGTRRRRKQAIFALELLCVYICVYVCMCVLGCGDVVFARKDVVI